MNNDDILASWLDSIKAKRGRLSPNLEEERRRLQGGAPLKVWLARPREGYPLHSHGPILAELLKRDGCEVELSSGGSGDEVIEAEPAELRSFDLLFLIVASPGTTAEAMELAMWAETKSRLHVFLPEEYKKGYLARSLGDRHKILCGLSFFSLKLAEAFEFQLPQKMLQTLATYRNLCIQGKVMQDFSCTVQVKTTNPQNMPNINVITAGTGAIVINQSTVENAFNSVKQNYGTTTADALKAIVEHVNKSGNKEAGELLNAFNEELTKREPKKLMLKAFWDGVCKLVPDVTQLAAACAEIGKLFS